jgi:hypothetical protein
MTYYQSDAEQLQVRTVYVEKNRSSFCQRIGMLGDVTCLYFINVANTFETIPASQVTKKTPRIVTLRPRALGETGRHFLRNSKPIEW